ncbi:glycosyltransferase [Candidatus Peregrinibacteria bacterium]|nr:glycosyltransferase [Candidatus Peregrinibacteria bacterium]
MDKPAVSIILPSLRLAQLKQCLASIKSYTVGITCEVIVISPFDIEPYPNVVHVKETKPEGVYKAVDSGYEQARGEYLIHIPDDSRATPHWAGNMIEFMRPYDNEIFEGNFRHFDVRGERPEPGIYGKLFAPFLCIRKDKADKIGGLMDCYYKSSWGDPDLSLRVWYNGGRVETCPNAWIYHADCNDEVHRESHDKYFIRDQQAFVRKWHHIYARPGESKNFYASYPIEKQNLLPGLPPEQCARLYVSIKRRDWQAVRAILTSKDTNFCFYPEGLSILYDYTMETLKLPGVPGETLNPVLEWIREKGYLTSSSNGKSRKALSVLPRLWSSIKKIISPDKCL